ncbi:hypothetical protein KC865_00925 [Candidatus Kaiserbacteria bacterium]|nr:hypothetical protein [Candidatus Kaiserbacteria bacterium]USN92580.1 MAG: hypothetical protein H6782_02060 [Candidatus Nomurabacteria bacterium]
MSLPVGRYVRRWSAKDLRKREQALDKVIAEMRAETAREIEKSDEEHRLMRLAVLELRRKGVH